MGDEQKDTIPFTDVEDGIRVHVQQYMDAGCVLVGGADLDQVHEVTEKLLREDEEFRDWPLSNKQGAQSTFLEHLLEKVHVAVSGPITLEPEAAEAYIPASTVLPEVPQQGDLPGPAFPEPEPLRSNPEDLAYDQDPDGFDL